MADPEFKIRGPSLVSEAIPEIEVLWITAGLGCDGVTIAITAATQPSLEDILLGARPGIPQVKLHNPFLSYENGEDFLEPFYRAAENKLGHFILVIEGSIPTEQLKSEGYWAAFVWFDCDVKMVRTEEGRPWFVHGIAFDISGLKEAEEALLKAHD